MDDLQNERVVDEFLVMRCQTGDRNALSALITKWQPSFYRYACMVTRDKDRAADAVQDAWIKIIKSISNLRDPLSFKAWSYRILNNQCIDLLRKTTLEKTGPAGLSDDIANNSTINSTIKSLETADQIVWVLSQLAPDHRAVLVLHYLQGFEVHEIARIVGIPQGTVKSRLHYSREKFRQLFDGELTQKDKSPPITPENVMNDLDAKIREVLAAASEPLDHIPEPSLTEEILATFSGRHRGLMITSGIKMAFVGFFALFCTFQFFQQETTMGLIAYASGAIICVVSAACLMLFLWVQMNHNTTVREIKRLELQIVLLMKELSEDGPDKVVAGADPLTVNTQ